MSVSTPILLLYGPHLFNDKATQLIITHLLAYFAIIGTPNSIKTNDGPTNISRHFKQFL